MTSNMKSKFGLDSLDSFGLDTLNPNGKPVKTRMGDVKSALSIYNTLLTEDRKSSINRARIDGMFDGVPPYDQAELIRTDQANKTNIN